MCINKHRLYLARKTKEFQKRDCSTRLATTKIILCPQCKNTDSYQNWSKVVSEDKKGKEYYATVSNWWIA
jgi:hypothetical protein